MRTFILAILATLLCGAELRAQTSGIGVHFGAYDFYGPQSGSYFLTERKDYQYRADTRLTDTSTRKTLAWDPLIKVAYWLKLSPHFDVTAGLSLSNLYYPISNPDATYIATRPQNPASRKQFLGELDLGAHYNILRRSRHKVSPYVAGGAHYSLQGSGSSGAGLFAGLGMNVRIARNFSFNAESAYKFALTDNNQQHLQHTVGFVYWFRKPKAKPVAVAPIGDLDKDGVPDDEDDCPTIPGPAETNGCPDRDGDGVPDSEDQCPDVAGVVENNGCPAIKKEMVTEASDAARNILFETGSATLDKQCFPQLDRIVKLLKNNPTLGADIGGHTDNVGGTEYNQELSEKRAAAVRKYLIDNGVEADRLSSAGYGEKRPIADNTQPKGRAQNRRTEVNLRNR